MEDLLAFAMCRVTPEEKPATLADRWRVVRHGAKAWMGLRETCESEIVSEDLSSQAGESEAPGIKKARREPNALVHGIDELITHNT